MMIAVQYTPIRWGQDTVSPSLGQEQDTPLLQQPSDTREEDMHVGIHTQRTCTTTTEYMYHHITG